MPKAEYQNCSEEVIHIIIFPANQLATVLANQTYNTITQPTNTKLTPV